MPELEQIADMYAARVRHTKAMHFFPRRKSSTALCNRVRLMVLRRLVGDHELRVLNLTQKRELEVLEQLAKDAGYTIHEVDLEDYR